MLPPTKPRILTISAWRLASLCAAFQSRHEVCPSGTLRSRGTPLARAAGKLVSSGVEVGSPPMAPSPSPGSAGGLSHAHEFGCTREQFLLLRGVAGAEAHALVAAVGAVRQRGRSVARRGERSLVAIPA